MFKSLLITVKTYIAAIMAIVGLVSLIWAGGMKAERKTSEKDNIKKDIIELKDEQTKQKKHLDSLFVVTNIKIDTISKNLETVQKLQYQIIGVQNAQRNSWMNWLMHQKTLTKEDFVKYMSGLEYQIEPADSSNQKKYEFNVSIKKAIKDKK